MTKKTKPTSKKQTTKTVKPSGLWLVKQEPEAYSWDYLVRYGRTDWTGVRNFQARNSLREDLDEGWVTQVLNPRPSPVRVARGLLARQFKRWRG